MAQKDDQWLLVGLGNPGKDYARHRHNAGFMVLDRLQEESGFPAWRKKFSGLMTEKGSVVLLKPMTYMNLSGQSVGEAARFYKIAPEHIVVFHDELDVAPGDMRIKKGGGSAGHNGLKSITAHLESPDYWRVRIGIGHPGHRDQVSDYVLSNFSKADAALVESVIEPLAARFETIVQESVLAYEQAVKEEIKNHGL
ncbi:MAG: aminoacyl-tRNA hydrolase [Alphaproteobacteria bacterium]|nr:aminoacyl-tRNA hydrolase [Alphaproteobacteria bacterium]